MGDRFTISGLRCPYCGKKQEEVYYAESSGSTTHTCENPKCKKKSNIIEIHRLEKIKR